MPLIPQGGNTGLVGAQVPLRGDEVIVSVTRLNRVREINAAAGHMTVEAGSSLEEAHEAAEAEDALFPLWIGSQGRRGSAACWRPMPAACRCWRTAMRASSASGSRRCWRMGGSSTGSARCKKDNTGYDLKDLLVGSEGTLGIITAATLKLFPRPEAYETAICNVASPDEALELLYLLQGADGLAAHGVRADAAVRASTCSSSTG